MEFFGGMFIGAIVSLLAVALCSTGRRNDIYENQ